VTPDIGIGLIGAGTVGRLHAGYLSKVPGARLVAIADVDRTAAEATAREHGEIAVHENTVSLLADGAVAAVVIATPGETHGRIIEAAASAGKHVFCEKPLDLDLARIDRALEAVRKAGVTLQVGFNRRFDRDFQSVRDAIVDGKVGEPHIIHLISRDPLLPGPPRDVGPLAGLLFDTTIHDFDMVRFLTGSEFDEVYVLPGDHVHRAGVIDTAVVSFRLGNGVIGTIDNSQAAYGYDQRVEVFGLNGAIAIENERRHLATVSDETGVHAALPLPFYPERYESSYIAELAAFAECIRMGAEPLASGADGRAASAAALAAQCSIDECRPVRIAEIS
jgi:myo-inositol 2-dehydrogenase/D-chiro-inositol 1-dehydrogenase